MRKSLTSIRPDGHQSGHGSERKAVIRRFEAPDEVRPMLSGSFDIVRIDGVLMGRATYEPGWRWSSHVGRALNQEYCDVEHLGVVISGALIAEFAGNRRVIELKAGDLFYIPPEPHDSWVVGTEPYVALHLLGGAEYAK